MQQVVQLDSHASPAEFAALETGSILSLRAPPIAFVDLIEGVAKHLIVLYKNEAGNCLYLYNENSQRISDYLQLLAAKVIILTNQMSEPGKGRIVGTVVVSVDVMLLEWGSSFSEIDLTDGNAFRYTFRDGYSLVAWGRLGKSVPSRVEARVH